MKKAFLGIDTSNYTTSCAAVDEEGKIVAFTKAPLKVVDGQRGLRQSDAVFAHVKQFPEVFSEVLQQADGYRICSICVSEKPRDCEDSYMPAFVPGKSFAQVAAQSLKVPVFYTTHQRGHIAAALISNEDLQPPFIAVHLSGGTTDFVRVDVNGHIVPFASSQDIHAGQVVDRIGVRLGLPFPSGKHLEELAVNFTPTGRYSAVVKDDGLWLSGIENQAVKDIEAGGDPGQVAAEVYDVLSRLVCKTLDRYPQGIHQVLLTGGVASSQYLRERILSKSSRIKKGFSFYFSLPEYAADNAAGVALIARKKFYTKEDDDQWLPF